MARKSKQFGLATVKKGLTTTHADFLKDVQAELVEEEHKALRDFIKGAYRLQMEKEKEIERLEKDIADLKAAIEDASKGDWEKLSKIKIPARFFEESTLRKHGKSLIEGSSEIRFVDLYESERK